MEQYVTDLRAQDHKFPVLSDNMRIFFGIHVGSIYSLESAKTIAFCNHSAFEILEHCNGNMNIRQLANSLSLHLSCEDIINYIELLLTKKIIFLSDTILEYSIDWQIESELIPWSAQIEITKDCQSRCKYCFNSSGKNLRDELDSSQWIKAIKILSEMGLTSVCLTGGEPFLKENFFSILDHCTKSIENVTVFTNGIYLSKQWNVLRQNEIEILKRVQRFQISIDSIDKEVHDKYRGKGSWDKAICAISKLRNIGCEVRISSTLHNENVNQIQELIAWAKDVMKVDITLEIGRASCRERV